MDSARRYDLDRLTPAELAIYKAMQEVERLEADERLTDAVIRLDEARNLVADFVDGTEDEDWIDAKEKKPEYETKVNVRLDNGEETIGLINDNYRRTCWLLKGTGGMFWRSMVDTVTHWKPLGS